VAGERSAIALRGLWHALVAEWDGPPREEERRRLRPRRLLGEADCAWSSPGEKGFVGDLAGRLVDVMPGGLGPTRHSQCRRRTSHAARTFPRRGRWSRKQPPGVAGIGGGAGRPFDVWGWGPRHLNTWKLERSLSRRIDRSR